MSYVVVVAMIFMLFQAFPVSAQHLESRDNMILNSITPESRRFIEERTKQKEDGFDNLAATMVYVQQGNKLPPDVAAKITQIADSDPGFKGLLACFIIITQGDDPSDKAIDNLIKVAHSGQRYLSDEKRAFANWVLLSYQAKILERQQTKKSE